MSQEKKGTTCIFNLLCLFKMSIKSIRQWGWHTVETYKGLTAEAGHIDFSTSFNQSGPWQQGNGLPLTLCGLRVPYHTDPEGNIHIRQSIQYIDGSLPCNNPLKLCDDCAIVICSNWIVIHSVNSVSIIWWFVILCSTAIRCCGSAVSVLLMSHSTDLSQDEIWITLVRTVEPPLSRRVGGQR